MIHRHSSHGSRMADEVKILQDFRDDILLPSFLGRSFVKFYYEVSPPVADFIAKHDTLRAVVSWSLLPIVGVGWIALKLSPSPTMVLVVPMLTMIIAALTLCLTKVRLIGQIRLSQSFTHG